MTTISLNTQESLLAFLRNNLQTEETLSIRGVAKLCGVDDMSIIRGADFSSLQLHDNLTEQGFKAADLVRTGFNAQATWLVIEYFAFISKAAAPGAKAIARTFGVIGVMQTFDYLKVKPEVKSLPNAVEYLKALAWMEKSQLPAALKQLLMDKAGDELCTDNQKRLAPFENLKRGVAQRAEELGYNTDASSRTKLGKFIVAQGLPVTKEERLCNGQLRLINVYEVTEELDNLIHYYFNN